MQPGEGYGLRQSHTELNAAYLQRQQDQNERAYHHMQQNQRKMAEIENRQRELEMKQEDQRRKNLGLSNPIVSLGQMPKMDRMRISQDELEDKRQKAKILQPAIFGLLEDSTKPSLQEQQLMKPPSVPMSVSLGSFGLKPEKPEEEKPPERKPKYYDEPHHEEEEEDEEVDAATAEKMRQIAVQNEMLAKHLSQLKQNNQKAAQSDRYRDDMDKLNALEAKLYDYNKHLESVKQMNRMSDDLNRMARNQALAAIKAGQAKKENMALNNALRKRVPETSPDGGDPWARKMIKAMMNNPQQMMPQMPYGGYQMPLPVPSPQPKSRNSSEEREAKKAKKEQDKKIADLNKELQKSKKILEGLKNAPQKEAAPAVPAGLTKEEVAKLIGDALNQQKPEIEKKAKEVGAGPEDIMTLPNGVTLIKPKDPSKPPLFIMPDDPIKKIADQLNKTKSSLSSSTSSISQSVPGKPNPLQQMMLGMLMNQNMRMMMGDDDTRTVSSSKTKSSKQQPIIIHQQPYIPPPAPLPAPVLPPIERPKRIQTPTPPQPAPVAPPQLPPIVPQVIQPQPIVQPIVTPVVQPEPLKRPLSIKSNSSFGAPLAPPVKYPVRFDANPWGLEPPKPSVPLDYNRAPSMRDAEMPSQGNLLLIASE